MFFPWCLSDIWPPVGEVSRQRATSALKATACLQRRGRVGGNIFETSEPLAQDTQPSAREARRESVGQAALKPQRRRCPGHEDWTSPSSLLVWFIWTTSLSEPACPTCAMESHSVYSQQLTKAKKWVPRPSLVTCPLPTHHDG